ncbi:MAG: LLM class F420-dependent oxidoreductase [Deltaproteobacteria bacterium]|nr:LLM class F420-dependent oxidoreductase [Deltaproteobacteria bacterium]
MKFATALAFSDPLHFVELARTADRCGWDWLAVSDHIVFPRRLETRYPYADDGKPMWFADTPWPDPLTAIAAMAAVTRRLRFLTHVYILPARHPLLVAKQVGTVAYMSGGRVALGVGAGWMKEEFDLLGRDFHRRGASMNEAIEVMRKLWQGGMVEYHGSEVAFEGLQMSPVPAQPVPILIGGVSDAALRRAARLGDGWISVLHSTDELALLIGRINELRREYGTDVKPFEMVVACSDAFDVDGYRRLRDVGATTLCTAPWVLYGADPGSLEEKQDSLERFAEDVIDKMRE